MQSLNLIRTLLKTTTAHTSLEGILLEKLVVDGFDRWTLHSVIKDLDG